MEKKLAKVENVFFGLEDHGILTFFIEVNYEDGLHQGIGGLALDKWSDEKERRVGTAYGTEMILRLHKTFGVRQLHELEGRIIYVLGEGEGFRFHPEGVAPLGVDNIKEKPLIFSEVLEEFGGKV